MVVHGDRAVEHSAPQTPLQGMLVPPAPPPIRKVKKNLKPRQANLQKPLLKKNTPESSISRY